MPGFLLRFDRDITVSHFHVVVTRPAGRHGVFVQGLRPMVRLVWYGVSSRFVTKLVSLYFRPDGVVLCTWYEDGDGD